MWIGNRLILPAPPAPWSLSTIPCLFVCHLLQLFRAAPSGFYIFVRILTLYAIVYFLSKMVLFKATGLPFFGASGSTVSCALALISKNLFQGLPQSSRADGVGGEVVAQCELISFSIVVLGLPPEGLLQERPWVSPCKRDQSFWLEYLQDRWL